MDSAMTAGEITLALAVILVLLALAAMVLRTRAIGRDGNLAVMAVRYPGASWRTGMVRYRHDRLEWFSFRSMTMSPRRTWARGDFFLGSRAQLADGDRPAALSGDAVSVGVRCGEEVFTIAMAPGDYTAMRSWSESAPPGLHADALV